MGIISRSENPPADLGNLVAELKNIVPVPRELCLVLSSTASQSQTSPLFRTSEGGV